MLDCSSQTDLLYIIYILYIICIKWYARAAPTVEKKVRSDSLAGDFRKLLQSPLFNLDN